MYDALIIGGGPAGATIGLLLAKAGWSIAIVEKSAFPRRKVCGEFISATNLSLLEHIGIGDLYKVEAGPEIRRVGLFAKRSQIIADMPSLNHQWGRAYPREWLDHALLNHAKSNGARIWQPWQARAIKKHPSYLSCQISNYHDTETLTARMAIIANGSFEKNIIPPQNHSHQSTDFLAFKAHFRHCELEQDLMPLMVFPGGYGGLVHIDNNKVTLSCCIRRKTLQSIRLTYPGLSAGDAVLKHIMTHNRPVRDAFKTALLDNTWLSIGPIRPQFRNCYKEGIFYVGNIAGEAHPVIAEGISMAMQSAMILAECLLKQDRLEDAGQEYTKQWNTQFKKRIYAASVFANLAIHPTICTLLVPIIKMFPKLLTYGATLSGKTHFISTK